MIGTASRAACKRLSVTDGQERESDPPGESYVTKPHSATPTQREITKIRRSSEN
jgi:hypothetical protein